MSLNQARRDIIRFSQKEWSVDLLIEDLSGLAVTVKGFASKHHLGIDPQTGIPVNTKNTHCSISEKVLTDAGFSVRNADKEVMMVGWKVTWTDSSGTQFIYKINETMPDETLGLIVCFLGDYG